MISVADNLRRALESVPEGAREDNEQLNSLLTGVEMTEKELLDALSRHGVRKMEPLGEKFDPNHHQAVVEVPNSDYANGQVAQVLQPGYMIHDRVLRAAMVGVAKGGQKQESQKADAGQSA
jgi:molecular chaperone GrpE